MLNHCRSNVHSFVKNRAKRERLHPAARADGGVQEEEEGAGVGLHRAGHVAEDDELARHVLAREERALDGVAAGGERAACEPAQVEPVAAWVGPAAARAAQRPQPRDVGDQAAGQGELLGGVPAAVLVPGGSR